MSGIVTTALALPLVFVLGVFALIALGMYLRHRERMTGWPPQGYGGPDGPTGSTGAGAPPDRWEYRRWRRDSSPLESALREIGVGLGLFFGLLTMGTGPWLLAGLIVLFIGLVRFGLMAWGLEPMGRSVVPVSALVRHGLYTTAIGAALLLGLGTLGIGPWLLGGSIPLGVGLSRLAAAVLIDRGWTQQ
jgi:hypothetical protein